MAHKSDLGRKVLTATEANRSFSAILDRIERGERFLVKRHGQAICVLAPPQEEGRRASECLALLRQRAPVLLDGRFAEDLRDILAREPQEVRPWGS